MVLKMGDNEINLYRKVSFTNTTQYKDLKAEKGIIVISTDRGGEEEDCNEIYKEMDFPDMFVVHGNISELYSNGTCSILGDVGSVQAKKIFVEGNISSRFNHMPVVRRSDIKACMPDELEYYLAKQELRKGHLVHFGYQSMVYNWEDWLEREKMICHLYPEEGEEVEINIDDGYGLLGPIVVEGSVNFVYGYSKYGEIYIGGDVRDASKTASIIQSSGEYSTTSEKEQFYLMLHAEAGRCGIKYSKVKSYLRENAI